ncbi:MAG: 1-deoxy-D-xylulose-5-phosphate synthase, partial [Rikenellaceae bacterium]|nr:1-deoxy-D-xylulose-5-phosphate synthase [Rikenellaceae bacterium]
MAECCFSYRGYPSRDYYIIEQCAINPGHLGSSLGTVELATAIHYVFNTPDDQLIWDVGHQAYAHKIITERRDAFTTNRKLGGLGGFPRRSESRYDAFVGGHSSVSISAALGMAEAMRIKGEEHNVVAVIGDGAMTGGLAFEGLNNAGASKANLLVILNDNNMSIDDNVGALKHYLLRITTSRHYNRFKNRVWNTLASLPALRRAMQKAGNIIKQGILQNSNLFESFGFRYFGPIDGHDITSLVRTLRDLSQIKGPKLLHVLTVKGKGYAPAEQNQSVWHAPGHFDLETGERLDSTTTNSPARYQDVFGQTLLDLARRDSRIVGITPAMPTGCSLNIMMAEMPERCFDVGIAEGHAVTFAAGLATQGMVPFCNIYSSFSQRAFDNIVHDVAIQQLPVVMCFDRAGLVGEDGATHHGALDLAALGSVPNLALATPMDEAELRNMMYTASQAGQPVAIRYPRGRGEGAEWRNQPFTALEIGRGRRLSDGDQVAVVSFGTVGNFVAKAIARTAEEGISVAHYDMRWAKPLDEELLAEIAEHFDRVITVEDGVIRGGAGSAVENWLAEHGHIKQIRRLGIPDQFVEHGTPAQLYSKCGYDAEGIYQAITEMVNRVRKALLALSN